MKYTSRYPGIKPFETDEKHIFFGRLADIKSLFNLICVEKTVLFYSKSGLGKTSLINAGLIPMLIEDNHKYNPIAIRLGVYEKNEDDKSLKDVRSPKEKAIDELKKTGSERLLKDFPELYENTLSFWLKSIEFDDPGKTHVLIFDQFEELFTYPEVQIKEFAINLNELLYLKTSANLREKILLLSKSKPFAFSEEQLNTLASALDLRLLFSIRSDKLSLLNRLTDYLPNLQRTFFELNPLKREDARLAIIEPAQVDGNFPCPKFEFKDGAEDKILDALSKNIDNTIATFQLQLVCQYAEKLILNDELKTKREIFPDDLGDINDIHQSFYDNLMAELPVKSRIEKINLHNLIEKEFIFEAEKRRQPVLKGVILEKISQQTLNALEETHLIRSEPYQDSFTYELSHDTLVEPILKSYWRRKEIEEREENDEKHQKLLKEAQDKISRQRSRMLYYIILIAIFFMLTVFASVSFYNAFKSNKQNKVLIRKYEVADSTRRASQVDKFIRDAQNYEMYQYIEDAERAIDSALKIDSNNAQAIELKHKYEILGQSKTP